ncbi:unnamed protein product [Closterium sp. NIES-53]
MGVVADRSQWESCSKGFVELQGTAVSIGEGLSATTHVTAGGIAPAYGYFKFSPDRITVAPLQGRRYLITCRESIEPQLEVVGLKSFADNTVPTPPVDDVELRGEFCAAHLLTFMVISRCCLPVVQLALRSCREQLDASHQAWHFIMLAYQVKDDLEEKMTHIRMGEQESTTDYCNRARRILAEMRMAGAEYSTASFITHVLKALPRSYNIMKRMTMVSGTRGSGWGRSTKDVNEKRSTRNKGRGGGGRWRECWICHDPDHLSCECPDRDDGNEDDTKGGRGRSTSRRPRRDAKPRKEKQTSKKTSSTKDVDKSSGKSRGDREASCSMVGVVEPTVSLAPEAGEDFQVVAAAVQANPMAVLLDSGCSHHLMGTKEIFVNMAPSNDVKHVSGFNGTLQPVEGRRTIALQGEAGKRVLIPHVLYVLGVQANLLSAGQLKESRVQLQGDGNKMLRPGRCSVEHATTDDSSALTFALAQRNRRRLRADSPCVSCIGGKLGRHTFPDKGSDTKEALAVMHIDLCGPFRVAAKDGSLYFLLLKDRHTRFVWVMPVAKKSDVLREFQNTTGGTSLNYLEWSTTPPGTTPYQLLTGKKPDLTLARVWGCMVQFMVPEQQLGGKLAPKARWGLHLGVSPKSKGWEVLDLTNNKVVMSVEMIFYETLSLEVWKAKHGPVSGWTQAHPQTDTSTATVPLLAKVDKPADEDVLEVLPPSPVLAPPSPVADRPALTSVLATGNEGSLEALPVAPASGIADGRQGGAYDDAEEDEELPELDPDVHADHEHRWDIATMTVKEAMASWKGEAVKAAMEEETRSLISMGTWELVERPRGVNIMKNRWVLTTKYRIDDTVERKKARLVVKGFTQVCGADYVETYLPVSSYVTLRIFLSIVAVLDLNLMQLDMKNAFLQSKLDRVLQMYQPDYFDDGTGRAAFELSEISPVVKYLGLEIVRNRPARKLWLHQQSYADKLHRHFIDEEQGGRVPKMLVLVDAYSELPFNDEEAKGREEEEYRQKVGSLQFAATTTRPDITFTCSKLGSGLTVRSDQHWREVDRCLAYLADTRDTALEFGGGPESLEVISYVDADDAGDKQKRTSTGDYVFVFGGVAISCPRAALAAPRAAPGGPLAAPAALLAAPCGPLTAPCCYLPCALRCPASPRSACCATMASLRILAFDHEGRPLQFDTWLDDLQLYLQSDSRDSVSLFDHTSGAAPAPPATADSATHSQWLTRGDAARLAIRNHLPLAKCAHFGQHRTAQALYDAVVARYSSSAPQHSCRAACTRRLHRPPGFTESFPAGTQWSLWRPVYGLRQAPREWHNTLRTTLAALGFTPSTTDSLLFLRTNTSLPPLYVLMYVDDLAFAIADTEALTLVKSEVLQRFGFQFSSPQSTPLSTGHLLSAPPLDESVEPSGPYPELVGCLMYLMTCTRPDLAYPLSLLARYLAPDASWVDDSATQRSSQGYTFSHGSGSVSWRSTRSSSVLSSSCEAEIYAGAMAAQDLRWLAYLLTDLGEQPCSPPVLYVDNKAMIALCQEHSLEHRTKHIALKYFLSRELQQRGQLRLAYMATRANTADIFAKALPPCDHLRFSTVFGLVLTLPHLLTA